MRLLDSVNAPLELALTFNPFLQCDQMSRISKGLLKNQRHVMEQYALKKCKQLFEYQHLLLLRDILETS
jgi:hypothetical protein